jgi:putative ABC transport system permease protein
VSVFETMRIAFSAVWVNRLRSVLTLLGVIIGVTSVITIISAIEGLMAGFEEQISELGPATFIVTKFGIITSDEEFFKALKRKEFTMDDVRAVAAGCQDCEQVAATADRSAKVKRGNKGLRRVLVQGSTANLIDVVDYQIAEGRSFTQSEYDRRNQVAFVGPTVVEELLPGLDPLGKTIKINGRSFTIIGVAKKRGSFLGENQDRCRRTSRCSAAGVPTSAWSLNRPRSRGFTTRRIRYAPFFGPGGASSTTMTTIFPY